MCHLTNKCKVNYFSSRISLYGDHNWKIYLLWAHDATVPSPPTNIRSSNKTRVSHFVPQHSPCSTTPSRFVSSQPSSVSMHYTALPPPVFQSQLFTSIFRKRSNTSISEWSSPGARPITHQNSWGSPLSKCPFCGHCDPRLQNHPATWSSGTPGLQEPPCFPFLHAPRGKDAGTADGRAHVAERAVILIAGARRLYV